MSADLARLRERAGEAALCLDFDGTLAPIVADPETAAPLPARPRVDPEARRHQAAVRAAGRELAGHPAVTGSGAHLEDKGLAVGVHLRRVPDRVRWAELLERAATEVAGRQPGPLTP